MNKCKAQEKSNCSLQMPIKVYICDDGNVVITDLLEWIMPVALALDPFSSELPAGALKNQNNLNKKGE